MQATRRQLLSMMGATMAMVPGAAFANPLGNEPDDAQIALRLLWRYHPGLLRYQAADSYAQAARDFVDAYRAGDLKGRYLALSRLTAAIRCGHTFVNPANQSDEVMAAITGDAGLLPFHFEWLGDEMVVSADPHGTGLAAGTVIRALDGVAPAKLLEELIPLTRADGSLDNKRRALLSVSGAEKLEMFDLLTSAMNRFGKAVLVETESGARTLQTIRVDARRQPDSAPGDWQLARDGRDAVMTMPGWAYFDDRFDWRGWLDEAMRDLAASRTRRLVIDLRGNEGGLTEIGSDLLSRLIDRPHRVRASRQYARFGTVAAEDRPYLSTWDDGLYSAGEQFAEVTKGWRRIPGEGSAIAPKGGRPAEKVAILVDAHNSSATGIFAEMVKASGAAILVGEETGRNRRGGNGGVFFFAKLPESGLEFDLPLVGSYAEGDAADRGTLPDISVPRTPASLAGKTDEAMAAALAALS